MRAAIAEFTDPPQTLHKKYITRLLSCTPAVMGLTRPHPRTEVVMADSSDSKKFDQMSGGEKIVFVGKLIIFLCSFGFAFPTLLND